MVRYTLVCAWLMMLLCTGLMAAEVRDLYRVEMAAQGKDATARAEDFRRGLGRVLQRVVRTEDLASAVVRNLLTKPDHYVLQFDYSTRTKDGQPVSMLRVEFDPVRVNDALRQRGIEVWGAQRPEVAVWLVMQDNERQPPASSAEQIPGLDHLVRELSDEVGVPLTAALWDLTDQQALTPADIETGDAERIRLASLRYETETALTGRLVQKTDKAWEANWRLYQGDTVERWQSKSANFREILSTGFVGAYTRLAARFIPRNVAATATLELRVTGIESLDDANRVAAYLGKLTPVTKLEWLGVGIGDASFRIDVRGGRDILEQTIALGNLLRPVAAADEQGLSGLTYQLMQ